MQDDTSATDTQVADPVVETPVPDDVLNILSDTEDQAPAEVVETQETEESDETETPAEVEATEDETETEDPELQTGEEEEVDPKVEAQRRYEERQQAKAEREARINNTAKEYIDNGEDEYDQRLRAMEIDNYKRTIESTENTLISEFERVKANPDLQIFNPDNKETFNSRAYDKAIRDYNAGYVNYDQNGNMVGVKGSLFEHLTETAELLSGAVKSGAVQQVRATRQMRSGADSKPAAQPKEAPKDDILDILKSD